VSDPQVVALAARTRAFVIEEVLPVEDRYDGDIARAGGDDFRSEPKRSAGWSIAQFSCAAAWA